MKRGSSSSKENLAKTGISKLSTRKHPLEHHLSSLSSTQAFFNLNNPPSIITSNTNTHPFYKTLGSNNFIEWSRPESKQAFRKFVGRPETSKGVRPMEKISRKWEQSKVGQYHSQYIPQKWEDEYRQQSGSHIEIIVTKSQRREVGTPKGSRSKFETDLDDQFLQLFAN